MISILRLVNTSVTSLSYLFFVVRTFKTYSLSNSQGYNIILLTVVIVLYLIFPKFIHLIIESTL